MTQADDAIAAPYLAWLRDLASHHRHGRRDRLGSANFIDDAARRRAAAASTSGMSVSLARPLATGPSGRQDGRPAFAFERFFTDGPIGMGSDHIELDCHGVLNTHLDALNHLAVDGTWYGGWAVDDPDAPSLADLTATGLVTRGIHLDIPALRGTPWVDADEPVVGADLGAALDRAGVTFEPGDALLVDMGRDRFEEAGHSMDEDRRPGIGADGARWLAERDVAVLCWDLLDARHPDQPLAAVHLLNWALGLLLVDNCDFRRLRSATQPVCTLVVAPLPVAGATGGNVNPLAVL